MSLFKLQNDRFKASEIFKRSKYFFHHLRFFSHSWCSFTTAGYLLLRNNAQSAHILHFLTFASVHLKNITIVFISFGITDAATLLTFIKYTVGRGSFIVRGKTSCSVDVIIFAYVCVTFTPISSKIEPKKDGM